MHQGPLIGDVRLIPARAGKTVPRPPGCSNPGAHPRACGENRTHTAAHPISKGSSPRVRGKRASRPSVPEPKGLIPARAGKTKGHRFQCLGVKAHPRACGENQDIGVLDLTASGSSPRVRGKHALVQLPAHPGGLIPARAGKT